MSRKPLPTSKGIFGTPLQSGISKAGFVYLHARLNAHKLALPELGRLPGAGVCLFGIVFNGSRECKRRLCIVVVPDNHSARADLGVCRPDAASAHRRASLAVCAGEGCRRLTLQEVVQSDMRGQVGIRCLQEEAKAYDSSS